MLVSALLMVLLGATASVAQETGEGDDRLLAEGRVVYDRNCVACHQREGRGISGQAPPLVNVDRLDDAEYVTEIIRGGLAGVELDGVSYSLQMPAFSALDDAEVAAVVAYVQEGLGRAAPPPPPGDGDATGGPAGTELPFGAVVTYGIGLSILVLGAAFVVGPVVLSKRDEGEFTASQVWLKAAAIVLYFVVATVILPSWLIRSSFLAGPPSVYLDLISTETWNTFRDLLGTVVWIGALVLGVWLLRRAQRDRFI